MLVPGMETLGLQVLLVGLHGLGRKNPQTPEDAGFSGTSDILNTRNRKTHLISFHHDPYAPGQPESKHLLCLR